MGINFQNVNFTYRILKKKDYKKGNIKYNLKDINISIAPTDEVICIVGHTGSGKSTLMQLCNCLNRPTEGSVTIYGKEVTKNNNVKLKSVRQNVGLVFQFPEYQLFESDCLKDIMFGPVNFGFSKEEAKNQALECAKQFNLSDDILSKSPFALSGGQKRKVALCGVLASNPNILILDEPTVGLDPYTKNELLDLINYYNKTLHKTIVIVTHDMDVVSKLAQRVIVLNKGNIIYDGDKHQLFNKVDLKETYNLDKPEISKIMVSLKEELSIDNLDVNKITIDEAIEELERIYGDQNE